MILQKVEVSHLPGEFQQFIYHAKGSLAEVETQLIITTNLKYVDLPEVSNIMELIARVGRLLSGLLSAIKKSKS